MCSKLVESTFLGSRALPGRWDLSHTTSISTFWPNLNLQVAPSFSPARDSREGTTVAHMAKFPGSLHLDLFCPSEIEDASFCLKLDSLSFDAPQRGHIGLAGAMDDGGGPLAAQLDATTSALTAPPAQTTPLRPLSPADNRRPRRNYTSGCSGLDSQVLSSSLGAGLAGGVVCLSGEGDIGLVVWLSFPFSDRIPLLSSPF